MKKRLLCYSVLSLFLLLSASITRAQTISSQKGLTTAIFPTQYGIVKVFLPDDIRPGELISISTVAEANGNNARQVEKNLVELSKFRVSIDGNKFPVTDKPASFKWLVHQDRQLSCPIELLNVSGYKAHELTYQIKPPGKEPATGNSGCVIPSHALAGSPLRITGPFDGNSSNTYCTLDNKPMEILAESPGQCIVSYPGNANGIQTLNVQENNQPKCSQQVSGVQMIVSAGKLNLQKRENTYIDVSITGLQNLPDTALLTLNNISTGIVTMQPSNTIVILLSPDSVGSGTFNKRFDIQSIRTGSFTVNVNLDLPDNLFDDHPPTQPQPGDHPPTQPQPGDNPQPKDTTQPPTQPHDSMTVAQCPGCNCSCRTTISFDAKSGDVSTYSAEVTASCTGGLGTTPPCGSCDMAYTYDWTVSFSADKPVRFVGGHNGPGVKISNPLNGSFTLTIVIKVFCGTSICTCKASTSYLPTITVDKCPGCQCECSATIIPVDREGDEWEYFVDVKKACTSEYSLTGTPPCTPCTDIKTIYLWSLGDDKVVKIVGSNAGQTVRLRIIKPGKFLLHVEVTVTCSDKKTCPCKDDEPGEVPEKLCELTWKEMMEPIMFGGLDPSSLPDKPIKIKRDDFIALKAKCDDIDHLKLICTKSKDCPDDGGSEVFEPLSGNVKFEWEIEGKGEMGQFVKIGCLGEDVSAKGEYVIFKPPYIPLPTGKDAKGKDITETTVTTVIKLLIIDDIPAGPLKDPTVERKITIITKRTLAEKEQDFYQMTVTEDDKKQPEDKEKYLSKRMQCKPPDKLKWDDVKSTNEKLAIIIPKIKDSDSLIAGEWLVLETNEQNDIDNLKVKCESKQCDNIRAFNKDYADRLEWVWTVDEGKGTFAGSKGKTDKGRVVIYQAPLVTKETEITITVTVNDDGLKFDDPPQTALIKIWVYPGGVKLDYPPAEWVPDPDKPATLKSYLVYKDKEEVWRPAFEHVRRIHFFQLMDVSNEKGVCLNAPISKEAKSCRDLLLKPEDGLELINLDDEMTKKAEKDKCDPTKYLLEARTAKPENKYEIKVYSEDYGSFGFLRSFANLNMHNETAQKKEIPYYESIPWTNKTVLHLHKPEYRNKKVNHDDANPEFNDMYPDNRVTIPYDIDENHIADNGWPTSDGKSMIPDPVFNNVDEDNKPAGDKTDGDGLSTYEEYRGFIVQAGSKKTAITTNHVRTNHQIKTIFIRNNDDLPIDLYKTITKLEVFELKEARYYQSDDERVVNFNSPPVAPGAATPSTHLVDQKGLRLIKEEKPIGKEHGKAFSLVFNKDGTERPAPPNWIKEIRIYVKNIENYYTPILKEAARNAEFQAKRCRDLALLEHDPKKKKAYLDEADEWDKEAKKDKDKQTFIAAKTEATVAHELLHANNVCHHGDGDQTKPDTYDQEGGLRSGDVSCVMRYDNLGTNITNGKLEAIGSFLCTLAAGTGYNANKQHFKDATNGNCKGQIRITGVGDPPSPCLPR